MIVVVDFVAQRYGVLPSQLIAVGSSLDVVVAQTAQDYLNKQQARAQGSNQTPNVPELSEKEMLDMIARAKEQAK